MSQRRRPGPTQGDYEPLDMLCAYLATVNEVLGPTIGTYLHSEATRRLRGRAVEAKPKERGAKR